MAEMSSEYQWSVCNDIERLPNDLILVGQDKNGADTFVGRIQHANNQLPATVIPNKRLVCAVHESTVIETMNFEFLTGLGFTWSIEFENGRIPDDAVPAGVNDKGDYNFIGRTIFEGDSVVGEIHPNGECMIFGYNSEQHSVNQYSVLCHPSESNRQALTRIPGCEARTEGYQWVSCKGQDMVPANAVLGGYDSDGRDLFVGRFWHEGDVLPAKIIGTRESQLVYCSAPYDTKEIPSHFFQVLTGTGMTWEHFSDGQVPLGAMEAGKSIDGESLYIGRGNVMNSLTPGKIQQSKGCLFIGHSWYEHTCHAYEVLVLENSMIAEYQWTLSHAIEQPPTNAIQAGQNVFVGRVVSGDIHYLASITPSNSSIVSSCTATLNETMQVEFLTGTGFSWSGDYNDGKLPKDAVPAGTDDKGNYTFIGRTTFNGNVIVGEIQPYADCMTFVLNAEKHSVRNYQVLQHPTEWGRQSVTRIPVDEANQWVTCKNNNQLPSNAVLAGWDDNQKELFIGRFWHEGDVLPAKVVATDQFMVVHVSATHNEKLVTAKFFQVLTGAGFSWQHSAEGQVPEDAIEAGKSVCGESLYIGRAGSRNSLIPGKIQPSHGCIEVGHDRKVKKRTEYEVLVLRAANDTDYQWLTSSVNQPVPQNALLAGLDSDGAKIYVGRIMHQHDQLPANIIPEKKIACAPYAGAEVFKNNFELLVGTGFGWMDCSNGNVPQGAIKSNINIQGETLYIGRVQNNKSLTVGKIHPSHRCIYIPHRGKEHHYSHYEVLVKRNNLHSEQTVELAHQWIFVGADQKLPPNAAVAGTISYNAPDSEAEAQSQIYVGRIFHEGEHLPAQIIAREHTAVATYGDHSITNTNYEVLTGVGFSWEKSSYGGVPPGAITSGKTVHGEWLFIGRTKNAQLGKVHPSHACIYTTNNGRVEAEAFYEVLVQRKERLEAQQPISNSTLSGNCCVCWENEAVMAVVPCGNLCMCIDCARSPYIDRCPVCRGPMMNCIRIYKT